MKESQLEILSVNKDLPLSALEKEELVLGENFYKNLGEWGSPYIKIPRKESKFNKRFNNVIYKYAKKIGADLAIIKYSNSHYPDNTVSYNIVFYRKK